RAFVQGNPPFAREALEQRPGCPVIVSDGGDEVRDARVLCPGQQRFDHPAGQALTTRRLRDRDLPDEEIVGRGWWTVARYPAHQLAVPFRDNAEVGEVGALQEVAIGRIRIERRASRDQCGDSRPISCGRLAKSKVLPL